MDRMFKSFLCPGKKNKLVEFMGIAFLMIHVVCGLDCDPKMKWP